VLLRPGGLGLMGPCGPGFTDPGVRWDLVEAATGSAGTKSRKPRVGTLIDRQIADQIPEGSGKTTEGRATVLPGPGGLGSKNKEIGRILHEYLEKA